MKRFNITWRGEVTVEADNEEEAREIFGNMDIDADDEYQDVTIGKARHEQDRCAECGSGWISTWSPGIPARELGPPMRLLRASERDGRSRHDLDGESTGGIEIKGPGAVLP
jgi:hypothetical protein